MGLIILLTIGRILIHFKHMKYITLLFCLLTPSCTDSPQEIQSKIDSPERIGKLEDGREVFMFTRIRSGITHYIYFVENTFSSNYAVGKSHEVVVYIDGVKYVKAEKE